MCCVFVAIVRDLFESRFTCVNRERLGPGTPHGQVESGRSQRGRPNSRAPLLTVGAGRSILCRLSVAVLLLGCSPATPEPDSATSPKTPDRIQSERSEGESKRESPVDASPPATTEGSETIEGATVTLSGRVLARSDVEGAPDVPFRGSAVVVIPESAFWKLFRRSYGVDVPLDTGEPLWPLEVIASDAETYGIVGAIADDTGRFTLEVPVGMCRIGVSDRIAITDGFKFPRTVQIWATDAMDLFAGAIELEFMVVGEAQRVIIRNVGDPEGS